MTKKETYPLVLQVVGYSNSGKTTLLTKVIASLTSCGYKIGTIKHDAHDFEMDKPGKDTWKHREAGAAIVSITSANKTAVIMQENRTIEELLPLYEGMDIVIIEGYKFAGYPKVVVLRDPKHQELLDNVTSVLAVASWERLPDVQYPQYDINDIEGITDVMLAYIKGDIQ
jgi:molybdopterin-guanine dinucleotide biosynthesis protein B